jgi:hypothetical protein
VLYFAAARRKQQNILEKDPPYSAVLPVYKKSGVSCVVADECGRRQVGSAAARRCCYRDICNTELGPPERAEAEEGRAMLRSA